ncbi:type IV secretion system protein [Cupriavidus gilardii]|nr:type IV secretion system protein [Cupriavidus gilardii]
MFFRKKKTENAPPGEERQQSTTPFLRDHGGKQDDRYMNLAVAAQNWRAAFRITAALLAVSMAFNGYYMVSSKFVPYVVAVDKLGHVVSVGVANRANPIDNKRVIREQMVQWVENSRLIVGDQAAQKRFIQWVYARVQDGTPAKRALDQFIQERKPFQTAAKYTVSAQVTVALPVSDQSYQVEWTEVFRSLTGAVLHEERWKGVFSYRTEPLQTEEGIRANGAGFFVTDFTWSKVAD